MDASSSKTRTLAVALHDIEPATFERCVRVREWLEERGVDRATLLVIPARDLHPLGERSPEMVEWLVERRRLGDSIAQHGFQHRQLRRANWRHRLRAPARTRRSAEFAELDGEESRRAVEAGWRLMKLAGIEPDGFVAPAYVYTPALRRALSTRFRWWADLLGLHGAPDARESRAVQHSASDAGESRAGGGRSGRLLAPVWSLSTESALERALSPASIRAGACLAGRTLRLDLRPCDLQLPRQVRALEWALAHATRRRMIATYNDLASFGPAASEPVLAGAPRLRRIDAEHSERLAA